MLTRKNFINVLEASRRGDFRLFKTHYSRMSFTERKDLENVLDRYFPDQRNFNLAKILDIFNMIINVYGESNIKVIELGCNDCMLADNISKEFNEISSWHGYDINEFAIGRYTNNNSNNNKVEPFILRDHFYRTEIDDDFDVFVSSHTLEHFNDDGFVECLNHISHVKYIIIELPIFEFKSNSTDTHVLKMNREEMFKHFKYLGYKMFYLFQYGKNNSILVMGLYNEDA
uniref:Putative methyltransferase n=1 Tax=viral metagenome TaxID=1070528 RepID=A0A6M3J0C0_9ZZZZ